jgi:hypothetical protein
METARRLACRCEEDPLKALGRGAARLRIPTELDRFVAFAESAGGISDADWRGVEAGGDEDRRRYSPEGGVTEEHYRRLCGFEVDRAVLARAVLDNMLRLRGHGSWARKRAFERLDDEDLLYLLESHTFEAAADAMEVVVRDACMTDASSRKGEAGETIEAVGSLAAVLGCHVEERLKPTLDRIVGMIAGLADQPGGSGQTSPSSDLPGRRHRATSDLLTEDEAIDYLRLDTIDIADRKATLRRYREAQQLRGTQVSKRVFYLRKELDAFLDRATNENPR